MRQVFAGCALIVLLSMPVSSAAEDIGKALNDQYNNKVMALRHSVQTDSQEYDSQGNLLTPGAEGSWTLYGRLLVDAIKVSPDAIELIGTRVDYAYIAAKQHFEIFQDRKHKRRIKVRIRLEKPLNSTSEALAVMGKVFALTDEDLLKSAPPWWQDYLATELGLAPKEKEKPDATALSRSVKPDENEPAKISSTGERIYPIAGLTAPKATFQPEPEFNDEARKAHYQGVVLMNIVIGSDGAVHDVVLVRPLGMGLDEMAVKGVKTWRFKPAAKNGEPVAVQVLVEMNFHFYR